MFYEIKEQLESIMLPNVNEEYDNNMLLDKHDKAYDVNVQNLDMIARIRMNTIHHLIKLLSRRKEVL
jgi:hypothetical protein